MPTFINNTFNLAGLTNPGVYIDIIPPTPFVVGAATNIVGIVGTAQWGPVGAPVFLSTPNGCSLMFGTPQIRTYDMPTYVWAASQVGTAIGFCCVRVTDGTDVAATATVQSTGLTLTSKYTGSLANGTTFGIATGTQANTYCLIVNFPGATPERFNNIGGSGNTFWVNAAAAINLGTSLRGPSNYVVATAGASTATPTLTGSTPITLSGGTDGVTSINTAAMLGQDTTPRKGMYSLRSTNVDSFALCDVYDNTSWAAQDAYALSENCVAVLTTISGDTISNAISTRTSAGIDDFPSYLLVGDWPTFFDNANKLTRLVSPQAYALGVLGNLSPQYSTLNYKITGVVATQRSTANLVYSDAEIQQAETGGVDIIVPPLNAPGGTYFTFITGRNTSSNTASNGIEYTRMTFFIARSLQSSSAGSFIGRLQSISPTDKTRSDAKFFLDSFMQNLVQLGLIDQFANQCDLTNNPPNLQAQGYLIAYCAVRFLNIVRYFVIQLAGGGNVLVTSTSTPPPGSSAALITL